MGHLKNSSSIGNNYIPCSLFESSQDQFKTTILEHVEPNWTHFTYKINEYGFRYDSIKKDKIICFVGCSITFGVGLPQDKIYPELVTKALGNDWQCMNISVPGSGPDVQMINLTWAINNFKIDKIVWYMSDPLRQMTYDGHLKVHVPNCMPDPSNNQSLEIINYVVKFEETILLKTYWNFYTLVSLIKEKNIDLYFRCWISEFHSKLEPLISQFNIKEIGNMNGIDRARDNMHQGLRSHQQFADHIMEKIDENQDTI
jgi:hypothetical protein